MVGSIATMWDGEIEGMRATLGSGGTRDVLVLSDSRPALAAVWESARGGRARTYALVEVVDRIEKLVEGGYHQERK